MRRAASISSRALVFSIALAAAAGFTLPAAAANLPAPYVSRALDAVLIPIDRSVIRAFGLPRGTRGVLVLATQPGGLADAAGILPGDVIGAVRGRRVAQPIDLDEIVYYWLLQGTTDFAFGAARGGEVISYTTVITMESWTEVIEITTVSEWTSYSVESFSYAEYYAEYSEEIVETYSESETLIEETVTSAAFTEEMTVEESVSDEEAVFTEDGGAEADAADDAGTADEGAADDGTGDAGMADDGMAEEPMDEAGGEEMGGEEMGGEEMGGEEPMDEAGGEAMADEPVEDQAAEEPVAEEPAGEGAVE